MPIAWYMRLENNRLFCSPLLLRSHWQNRVASRVTYLEIHMRDNVNKVLKPFFWTSTIGFPPTQSPIHLIQKWHFRGLVHILSCRPQKSDCQNVLPMSIYPWFSSLVRLPTRAIDSTYQYLYLCTISFLYWYLLLHLLLILHVILVLPLAWFTKSLTKWSLF